MEKQRVTEERLQRGRMSKRWKERARRRTGGAETREERSGPARLSSAPGLPRHVYLAVVMATALPGKGTVASARERLSVSACRGVVSVSCWVGPQRQPLTTCSSAR